MRTSAETFMMYWSVVKTHFSGWYVILALLFLSVSLSGCEKEDSVYYSVDCITEVKAVRVPCSYGALGDIWFINSEGEYLQPWVMYGGREPMPRFVIPVPGQFYKIGYIGVKRDNKYEDDRPRCMAALPQSEAVNITCLSPVVTTVN